MIKYPGYSSKHGLYYEPKLNRWVYAEKKGMEEYGEVLTEFNSKDEFHNWIK